MTQAWQEWPDHKGDRASELLVRVTGKKPIRFLCLSDTIVGAQVHYAGKRTNLCLREVCPICARREKSRWTGFVCGMALNTHKRAFINLTELAAAALRPHFEVNRTLRGAIIDLRRARPDDNAPLLAEVASHSFNEDELPVALDTWAFIRKLWNLETLEVQQYLGGGNPIAGEILPPPVKGKRKNA